MINELSFSKVKLLINLESCFRRLLNNMTLSYSLTILEIEFQIIVPLCRRESLPISFLGLSSTSCLDRRESYFVAFTENNSVI